MRINAINSNNFQNQMKFKGVEEKSNGLELLSKEDQQAVELLDKVVSKANSNVHPATIIGTVLSTAVFAAGGVKYIPVIRKGVFKATELISRGATKVGGEVANLFRKQENKLVLANADEKLTNSFRKFYSDDTSSKKVLHFLKKETADVIGEKTTNKLAKVARDTFNIKSDLGLIDAGIAMGIAGATIDPVSDGIEEHKDGKDIAKAVCEIAEMV